MNALAHPNTLLLLPISEQQALRSGGPVAFHITHPGAPNFSARLATDARRGPPGGEEPCAEVARGRGHHHDAEQQAMDRDEMQRWKGPFECIGDEHEGRDGDPHGRDVRPPRRADRDEYGAPRHRVRELAGPATIDSS